MRQKEGTAITEFAFKRLLTPTGTDERHFFRGDYTLNLYRGCNHGCAYCDSRSVCYHMDNFDHIRVKANCLPALEGELRARKRAGVVNMGAASDAYNALEAKLRVTRGALELLRRYGFGIFIPTKGALIARDADVLGDIARSAYACVAFSLSTSDAGLAALLEPGAPPPQARYAAMRALADAGVYTGTWLNPMLPFLTDTPQNIRDTLARTADAGGRFALCHFGVTLREGDREYFYRTLDAHPALAGVKARYVETFGLRYLCASPEAEALQALFDEQCERLGLCYTFEAVNRAAAAGEPRQLGLFGDAGAP